MGLYFGEFETKEELRRVAKSSILTRSLPPSSVFTFPSAFAQNAATLVVGRAIAGLAASAPMTVRLSSQTLRDSTKLASAYLGNSLSRLLQVIGGCIADMWDARQRGWPMAAFSGTLFVSTPSDSGFSRRATKSKQRS